MYRNSIIRWIIIRWNEPHIGISTWCATKESIDDYLPFLKKNMKKDDEK